MHVTRTNIPTRAKEHPLFFKVLPVSADVVELKPLDFAQCKANIIKKYSLPGAVTYSPKIREIENCYDWNDLAACSGYSVPTLTSIAQADNLNDYFISVNLSNDGHYEVTGQDRNGQVSGIEPDLTLYVGDSILFTVNAVGHPLYIKTVAGTGTTNLVAGIVGQGAQTDHIRWTPNAAGTYYYQCGNHGNMLGVITVAEYSSTYEPSGSYNPTY